MKSRVPHLLLGLLLAGAVGVLVAGFLAAERKETEVVPRDRGALTDLAVYLAGELRMLDELYTSHLKELAGETSLREDFAIKKRCEEIVGIAQFSILSRAPDGRRDRHLKVRDWTEPRAPAPSFSESDRLGAEVIRLSPVSAYLDGLDESGWIDEPGKPLMYWARRSPNEIVVLLVNRAEVAAAITGWLREYEGEAFETVAVGGGPDVFRAGNGDTLFEVAEAETGKGVRPDLLLPLRTRYGDWHLESWDRRVTTVRYDQRVISGTWLLALLLALTGVALFRHQRSVLKRAAQQVSFVNRVSHELRTPLTNIILNTDLVSEALSEKALAGGGVGRRLSLVREECRRLNRLIANVLSFSGREQNRNVPLSLETIDPVEVCDRVLESFGAVLERKGLVVKRHYQTAKHCRGSADSLAQILANLVSNVEKYAVSGGVLEVAVTGSEERVSIQVSDAGPGIPRAAEKKVFTAFYRVDKGVTEGVSGTGLGLAIARDLAEDMGGGLYLLPSQKGARFEVSLPEAPGNVIDLRENLAS